MFSKNEENSRFWSIPSNNFNNNSLFDDHPVQTNYSTQRNCGLSVLLGADWNRASKLLKKKTNSFQIFKSNILFDFERLDWKIHILLFVGRISWLRYMYQFLLFDSKYSVQLHFMNRDDIVKSMVRMNNFLIGAKVFLLERRKW